mmetsp:Transcript_8351/g.20518  ORF Transcript_8351/g.20518 Transcript_8351/m.20518 type:complete len:219 (-) Transcript_8351:563-1219(-)
MNKLVDTSKIRNQHHTKYSLAMAPPASLKYPGSVWARCSIFVTSPSLDLYNATSSSPLRPTYDASNPMAPSSFVARRAYSLASAVHPICPSLYVPAPTTEWPGRGAPVAMARTASSICILSDSFFSTRPAEAFRTVWPDLLPGGGLSPVFLPCNSFGCVPCIRPVRTSLPSPSLSRHCSTHEHMPFSVARAWTCWPFTDASSLAMSNNAPHAARNDDS